MSKTKTKTPPGLAGHTPGEWTVDPASPCRVSAITSSATVRLPFDICPRVWGQNGEEAKANARLIAAAPGLLAALESAERKLTEFGKAGLMDGFEGAYLLTDIRAAIQKARKG